MTVFKKSSLRDHLLYKPRMSESLIFLQFWSDFDGVLVGLGPQVTGKLLASRNTQGVAMETRKTGFQATFHQEKFGLHLLQCLWTNRHHTWWQDGGDVGRVKYSRGAKLEKVHYRSVKGPSKNLYILFAEVVLITVLSGVTCGPRPTLSGKPRRNRTKIEEKLKIPTSEFYIKDYWLRANTLLDTLVVHLHQN